MKNLNRSSFHGHHGSKRLELVQHAHSRGPHAFTIIMKNFNRRNSHGHRTMAESAANWRDTHTHSRGSHAFTHTLIHQHSYNHCYTKRQLSYYRIWNRLESWAILKKKKKLREPLITLGSRHAGNINFCVLSTPAYGAVKFRQQIGKDWWQHWSRSRADKVAKPLHQGLLLEGVLALHLKMINFIHLCQWFPFFWVTYFWSPMKQLIERADRPIFNLWSQTSPIRNSVWL